MSKKQLINWLPALIVMILISILSSTSGETINELGLGNESIHISGHSIMFFFLCVAYFKATKNIIVSIVLTFCFGMIDEFHQLFTPLRSSSLFDIYTDGFGSLIAGLILWKLQYILPKKLKNWLNN
jgi:VanZ family protein